MKKSMNKSMHKRGMIIEIGAIVIIAITTIGLFLVATNESPLYIGDKQSKNYLNYFKCKEQAQSINSDNLITFSSEQDAINREYEPLEECV